MCSLLIYLKKNQVALHIFDYSVHVESLGEGRQLVISGATERNKGTKRTDWGAPCLGTILCIVVGLGEEFNTVKCMQGKHII